MTKRILITVLGTSLLIGYMETVRACEAPCKAWIECMPVPYGWVYIGEKK